MIPFAFSKNDMTSSDPGVWCLSVADLENFGGGGDFKHKISKIRMSSPRLRVIFRPKSEIQRFFSPKIRWSPKKKKKKRSSPIRPKSQIQRFFRPKSGGIQNKKKKKKVFTEIENDFSAEIVSLRLVGGDASPNGAELFQIVADFSAEIVTFRLVGGMHPPHPPLNPPLVPLTCLSLQGKDNFAKACDSCNQNV